MFMTILQVIGGIWFLGIIPVFVRIARSEKGPTTPGEWAFLAFLSIFWPITFAIQKIIHLMLGY